MLVQDPQGIGLKKEKARNKLCIFFYDQVFRASFLFHSIRSESLRLAHIQGDGSSNLFFDGKTSKNLWICCKTTTHISRGIQCELRPLHMSKTKEVLKTNANLSAGHKSLLKCVLPKFWAT